MSELVIAEYERMKEKLIEEIKKLRNLALTIDSAALLNGDNVIAITGHWITLEWHYRDGLIGLNLKNSTHTAEAIMALVQGVTTKFHLGDTLDSITTDSGANFVAAVKRLVDIGYTEENPRCACHSIQTSLSKALRPKKKLNVADEHTEISLMVIQVRKIAVKIKKSTLRLDYLKKYQQKLHDENMEDILLSLVDLDDETDDDDDDNENIIDTENNPVRFVALTILMDVQTRWNSIYIMLSRFLQLKLAIIDNFKTCEDVEVELDDELWVKIELTVAFLKPFKIYTDFLQGQKYSTLAAVGPILTTLLKNLQNNVIDITFWKFHNYSTWDIMPYYLQQARNVILQDMLLRFKPSNELYGMASLMHIAYKKLTYLSNT